MTLYLLGSGAVSGLNALNQSKEQQAAQDQLQNAIEQRRSQRDLIRDYVRGEAFRDTEQYRNLMESPYDNPIYQAYLSRVSPVDATREQAGNMRKMGVSPESGGYNAAYNRMLTQNAQNAQSGVNQAMLGVQKSLKNPYTAFMNASETTRPEEYSEDYYSSQVMANQPDLSGLSSALGQYVSAKSYDNTVDNAFQNLSGTAVSGDRAGPSFPNIPQAPNVDTNLLGGSNPYQDYLGGDSGGTTTNYSNMNNQWAQDATKNIFTGADYPQYGIGGY